MLTKRDVKMIKDVQPSEQNIADSFVLPLKFQHSQTNLFEAARHEENQQIFCKITLMGLHPFFYLDQMFGGKQDILVSMHHKFCLIHRGGFQNVLHPNLRWTSWHHNFSKLKGKIMQKIKVFIGFIFLAFPAFSQTTPDQAAQAALQNHPLTKAAAFEVQAKKYGEKVAFNPPNPEVNAESPTGEFYAVGILQSFEFPTVYTRQKQVAKAETGLAQAGQRVSENDLRYTVRSLYLETQVAEYRAQQWGQRDELIPGNCYHRRPPVQRWGN